MRDLLFIPFKDVPIVGDEVTIISSRDPVKLRDNILKHFFLPDPEGNDDMTNKYYRMITMLNGYNSGNTAVLEVYKDHSELSVRVDDSIPGERFRSKISDGAPLIGTPEVLIASVVQFNNFSRDNLISHAIAKRVTLLSGNPSTLDINVDDLPKDISGLEARNFMRSVRKDAVLYSFPTRTEGACNAGVHYSFIDFGINPDERNQSSFDTVIRVFKKIIANKIGKAEDISKDFPGYSSKHLDELKSGSYDMFTPSQNSVWKDVPGIQYSYPLRNIILPFVSLLLDPITGAQGTTMVIRRNPFGKLEGFAIFSTFSDYMNWYLTLFRAISSTRGDNAANSYMSGTKIYRGFELQSSIVNELLTTNKSCVLGNFPMPELVR